MAEKPAPRKPAPARPGAAAPARPNASKPAPTVPARPISPQAAPARPIPATATAAARSLPAGQQKMRDQGAQRTAEDEQGDEETEEAGAAWSMILRQSPSWLTSAVVHLVLVLVLALCVTAPKITESVKELVIGKPEVAEEKLDDGADEQKNEKLDSSDVKVDSNLTADVAIPIDTAVDSDKLQIDTQHDDVSLAAPNIQFQDFGAASAVTGSGELAGMDKSGLGSRSSAGKRRAAKAGGAGKGTDSAVEGALRWLAEHQNSNGSWSFPHTPGGKCNGFPNPGSAQSLMGATGLALLPFLGAGYTHKAGPDGDNNKYRETVRRGVNYLVGNMKITADGGRLFDQGGAGQHHMYSHGIAACALAEAYGMTQDKQLKQPAQLALNYIYTAQHPENGGWLYEPRQGGDTSVVGWQIMAIKSGVLSYLDVPKQVKPLANKWLDSVSWDSGSSYGYRAPNDRPPNDACTAIGLLCRNYLGWKKDHPGLIGGVKKLSDRGPTQDNMYYNYYGSMVMYQNDGPKGEMWRGWDKKMQAHLLNTQVKQGKEAGSWHFDGGHGDHGGRVYNTALCAMTLEVYYRYLPVYQHGNVDKSDFPTE